MIEQQPNRCSMPGPSCGVQSCPAAVLRFMAFRADQVRIPGKQYAQSAGIAAFARFKKPRGIASFPLFNLRFQGSPTWETVISGSGEQSIGKLRFGIDPPQLLQSILRQLL
jgi:hypothetical protein